MGDGARRWQLAERWVGTEVLYALPTAALLAAWELVGFEVMELQIAQSLFKCAM